MRNCFRRQLNGVIGVAACLLIGIGSGNAVAQTTPTDWTGFYLGIHGGHQWSDLDLTFEKSILGLGDGVSLDTSDGTVGFHGGYQQQNGNFVLGLDLTGSWTDGDGAAQGDWEYARIKRTRFGRFGFFAGGSSSV